MKKMSSCNSWEKKFSTEGDVCVGVNKQDSIGKQIRVDQGWNSFVFSHEGRVLTGESSLGTLKTIVHFKLLSSWLLFKKIKYPLVHDVSVTIYIFVYFMVLKMGHRLDFVSNSDKARKYLTMRYSSNKILERILSWNVMGVRLITLVCSRTKELHQRTYI